MFATLNLREGRIEIGLNQWSDYGPNTAIVQNFAFGKNFPAEYPHYAHEPIKYHFLFYFMAGNLEFLGLNLAWAENAISILIPNRALPLIWKTIAGPSRAHLDYERCGPCAFPRFLIRL